MELPQILLVVLSALVAYIIGAVPTAYLFGRWLKGINIREYGSKNVGATNAIRVLGKGPGAVVLAIDILKGVVPTVWVARALGIHDPMALVTIGLAAVIGHNWTIFLGFKGGKGVATSLGVIIGLAVQIPGVRPVLGLTLAVWLTIFLTFGYVSLASICAATVFPLFTAAFNAPFPIQVMAILLCVFIVLRHKANISRLAQGKETRVKLVTFSQNRPNGLVFASLDVILPLETSNKITGIQLT
ncbi:MAG: glycerol-3-phosphate 1-O-acyltransferase PlsY [Candidatus Omnitrophica bacterium]|nr:glycerol-3-phosphate 1-O-acyltransferase PlsY [Candidatus Omnitrophota bacterium]